MGANLPKNPKDAVAWILHRAGDWQAHAAELGLDPSAAADMVAIAQAAEAARLHASSKRSEAVFATRAWRSKADEAMDAASVLISTIKATAQGEDEKGRIRLYGLAKLCLPRARRRRAPRPGRVTDLRTRLLPSGSLELRFEANHPKGARGVLYEIWRQEITADGPGAFGPFTYVATARTRTHVDRAVPPGTIRAIYRITPTSVRGRGAPAEFPVNFSGAVGNSGAADKATGAKRAGRAA